MKAILFHNPKSGTGEFTADELKAILRLAGHDVTYCSTKSSGFKSALRKSCELAVVAGGDGTVGKVLKGLKHRSTPIGILPLGTANNIATSLGISGSPAEIAASWNLKRTRKLSVGIARGPWGKMNFIEAVGYGAMVDATDSSIGENVEGDHRLVLGRDALRRALKKGKARNLHVTIDGKPITSKLLALEVLNIGYAGPGIPLRLAADPGDDYLDVVMIGDDQREDMLDWLGPAHEETSPPLTARKGKEIVIAWKGKPPMRLDDGYVDPPDTKETITLTLAKEKLTILLPKGARKPVAKHKARARTKRKAAK
ncbi:MAG: diacylglycerol kinase family protein [Micropepsaceae bacterium]